MKKFFSTFLSIEKCYNEFNKYNKIPDLTNKVYEDAWTSSAFEWEFSNSGFKFWEAKDCLWRSFYNNMKRDSYNGFKSRIGKEGVDLRMLFVLYMTKVEAYDYYINNVIKASKDGLFIDKDADEDFYIALAFIAKDTPEGFSYWNNINRGWLLFKDITLGHHEYLKGTKSKMTSPYKVKYKLKSSSDKLYTLSICVIADSLNDAIEKANFDIRKRGCENPNDNIILAVNLTNPEDSYFNDKNVKNVKKEETTTGDNKYMNVYYSVGDNTGDNLVSGEHLYETVELAKENIKCPSGYVYFKTIKCCIKE